MTHRRRTSLLCALAGAVLLLVALCSPVRAQDSVTATDPPVQVDQNQLVDPEATATPAPPAAEATPEGDEPKNDGDGTDKKGGQARQAAKPPTRAELGQGNAALQPREDKDQEAEKSCKYHSKPTSGMLAIGGSVGGEAAGSWTGLALAIAGGALALFTAAFGFRRALAARRHEAPAPKSALEVAALVVAILGGVAALVAQLAPDAVSRDRPPPQATMVVRDVNARITRGDFAEAVGADQPPSRLDRIEIGNVVWLKLRLEGYRGRSLVLQWGSYEDGDGGALLPGTARNTDFRVDGDTDIQDVVQPVWVGYPKRGRFRVLFRLLDRARVQEMARSPAMDADARYACARRA